MGQETSRTTLGPDLGGGIRRVPYSTDDAVYYYEGDWQYSNQSDEAQQGPGDLKSSTMENHLANTLAQSQLDNAEIHRLIQAKAGQLPESHDGAVSRSHSVEEERDSFTAFTETVEALALQKSVIGDKNIKPASADEIARVIAQTQLQMGKRGRSVDDDYAPVHAGILSPLETHLRTVGSVTYNGSDHQASTKDAMVKTSSPVKTERSTVNGNIVEHTVYADEESLSRPSTATPPHDMPPAADTRMRYYDFVHEKEVQSTTCTRTSENYVVNTFSDARGDLSDTSLSSRQNITKGPTPVTQQDKNTADAGKRNSGIVDSTENVTDVTYTSYTVHSNLSSSHEYSAPNRESSYTSSVSDSLSPDHEFRKSDQPDYSTVTSPAKLAHKRSDSVDSDRSKESGDSVKSKELIRIIPSDIKKEKATWFSGAGPPMEKQRPKHLEGEISVSEEGQKYPHESGKPDLGAHEFTVTNREGDVTVSGIYTNTEVRGSEQVLFESEVVVTQTNKSVSDAVEEQTNLKIRDETNEEKLESKALNEPGKSSVDFSKRTNENFELSSKVSQSHTDNEKIESRDAKGLEDAQNEQKREQYEGSRASPVMTSTPLKTEPTQQSVPPSTATPVNNSNPNTPSQSLYTPTQSPYTPSPGPVNAPPQGSDIPAPSPYTQSNPILLSHKAAMLRNHSGSNLSISDNVSESNRSRASSVSSVSGLEFLQSDSSAQVDHVSFVAYDLIKQELDRALREKAKLEGQNEVLQQETKTAIKQRADLQAQVAGLITQVKANESMHNKVVEERNSLAVDLDLLKQKRTMLEHVIVDSNKLLEEKTSDLKTLQEDYQISQENSKKLEDKVKDVAQEMKAKEGTIQALKSKVAELYVEFQSTNQVKIHAENELQAAQSEISSLKNAKEWYDKQIKTLQAANSDLKHEMTRVQGQSIAQATLIERMKAENVRMRQLQTDLQQKALLDKEGLARQLEAIEADILQREAQFQEILQERETYNIELRNRMETGESQGSFVSENTTEEVRKLQHEVHRKTAEIQVMEREQKELVKRLTLSQESILERDKALESLERKYVEVETQLSKIQQEMLNKEEEYLKINEERHAMEVALTSAKEEKSIIDDALQTVKADMGKVERTFKQMKLELTNKKDELQASEQEKGKLQEEINILRDQLEEAVAKRGDITISKSESLSDEEKIKLAETSNIVLDLKAKVISMETEINNLKHELSVVECAKQAAAAEKGTTEKERDVTRARLEEMELKLKGLLEEKSHLEGELEISRLNQDNTTKLEQEVLTLKGRVADIQKDSHREIAKQKGKALKLGSDLSRVQKELKKKTSEYEKQASQLQQELAEAREAASRREGELQRLQERFTLDLDEQRESLTSELANLRSEYEAAQNKKLQLEAELANIRAARSEEKEKYKAKLEKLEKELAAVKEYRERQLSVEENQKQLTLDLEKERGKYTGILQSHSALKEHAHVLEEALAMRESSVAEMSTHVQEEFVRRDKMAGELKAKVKELEEQLNREKASVKDSKKQLMTEKGKHVKLRREHEALRSEHDRLLIQHETASTTLQLLQLDITKISQSEKQYRTQLEKVTSQYNEVKVIYEQLKREAEERSAKDPLTEDQIKTLQWQNEQKAAELEAVQQQLQLAEERQALEVESLRQTLQTTSSELVSLRTEISAIKQEKVKLQSKVTDLKGALRSTIMHLKNIGQTSGARPRIDLSALEQLLQDTASSAAAQNKPLSFLQATLSGLRGEISTLQKQVDEHTAAVRTSTTSWRELEDHVKALREVCRSSATERTSSATASDTAVSSEEAATEPESQDTDRESSDFTAATESQDTDKELPDVAAATYIESQDNNLKGIPDPVPANSCDINPTCEDNSDSSLVTENAKHPDVQ